MPRYLSADDLPALLPAPADAITIAEAALKAAGEAGADNAGSRWVRDWSAERTPGLPSGVGLVALLDESGAPTAILDRPTYLAASHGACTAVAGKQLAMKDAEVITVLGCNRTGRAVMDHLMAAFPDTERMLCWDPDIQRQASFADEVMTSHELSSIIPPEPREATEGAHILVSCLTVDETPEPVVEPEWLQTATLCIALDLDTTFTRATFEHVDRRITDCLGAYKDCVGNGHLSGYPEPDSDLAAIVAGKAPGRGEGVPIILSVHVGHPAVDVALAGAALARAEAEGKGTVLG